MLALIAVIIAAILLLPSCGSRGGKAEADTESTTLVKAGDKAPDFTVEMFDGTKTSLAELKGKVVLLNFWATWCPPCRQELTRVQKDIIDRFAGRNFVFLPISRGEKREDVAAFREKTGYTFPMGLDPSQAIYDRYASNYIPRNFLIGADQEIPRDIIRGITVVNGLRGVEAHRERIARLFAERRHVFPLFAARYGQEYEVAAGETVDDVLLHAGQFLPAGRAPGGPKVQ